MKKKLLLLLSFLIFTSHIQCGKGGFAPFMPVIVYEIGEKITIGLVCKTLAFFGLFGAAVYVSNQETKKKKEDDSDLKKPTRDETYIEMKRIDFADVCRTNSSGPDDDDNDKNKKREKPSNKTLERFANFLGYFRTKKIEHGQLYFQKGPHEITYDVDGHVGGFWKWFKKNNRLGTYDIHLRKKLGD